MQTHNIGCTNVKILLLSLLNACNPFVQVVQNCKKKQNNFLCNLHVNN